MPDRPGFDRSSAPDGVSRRDVLHAAGLSAFLLGAARLSGRAVPPRFAPAPRGPLDASRPFAKLEGDLLSRTVGGLPFAQGFTGDPWGAVEMPFHTGENNFPGGVPPQPDETVDVAIVGGGLSGLATAFLLRHRRPVVFELRARFGGVSQGEIWSDVHYSLGGAYFIAPDKGSFLERLYRALGLDRVARVSYPADDPVELGGVLRDDFWSGMGLASADVAAFNRYADIVRRFGERYPDIPLIEGRDNRWILELDRVSLREDLEQRMGGPLPRLLVSGIQGYCFSSFNSGWEEISAASGWNFIAAEEFGRWVCPGGNVWVADELWRRLVEEYGDADAGRLRPATRVVDVRPGPKGLMQVSYRTPGGEFRSLHARQVVMACSKHICKYVLHDLANVDLERLDAMHQVLTTAYLVANVLLTRPVDRSFYDIFLLGDGELPLIAGDPAASARVIDVLSGHYAHQGRLTRGVLTLYWPLPSPEVMFHALVDGAWDEFTQRLAPQVEHILRLLGLRTDDVLQVRLARWGHAMPVARVGFIDGGVPDKLRSPYLDRVWFVNQDNWALPAFETCLLEADHFARIIDDLL